MECDTVTDNDVDLCSKSTGKKQGYITHDTQSWKIRSPCPFGFGRASCRTGNHWNDRRLELSGRNPRWDRVRQLLPNLPRSWYQDMPRLLIGKIKTFAAAVVVLVASTVAATAEAPSLSASDASQRVADGELILLDIRRPEEWKETGIAKGAWPVSMHTPQFPQQLRAILDQYAPNEIALICATGGRTAYVADILEQNGISGVYDVSEGMLGNGTSVGWIENGLPIVTAEEAQIGYEASQELWD
jgi:rhodanese-related sulfurtransferase